jgi:hypothetical protein
LTEEDLKPPPAPASIFGGLGGFGAFGVPHGIFSAPMPTGSFSFGFGGFSSPSFLAPPKAPEKKK